MRDILLQFRFGSLEELQQDVSRLAAQVQDNFNALPTLTAPRYLPTPWQAATQVMAKLGEHCRVDPGPRSVAVLLPEASTKDAGLGILLTRRVTSNTVTVRTVPGQLINASTNVTIGSALGPRYVHWDGEGYQVVV